MSFREVMPLRIISSGPIHSLLHRASDPFITHTSACLSMLLRMFMCLACIHFMSLHVALWLKPSGLRLVNVPSLRVLEKEMTNELLGGYAFESNQLRAHLLLVTSGFRSFYHEHARA